MADTYSMYDHRTDQAPAQPGDLVFTWIRGTDVKAERIDWWEPNLIPRGYLTVLAGRGDVGKSTAAASWAAQETRNGGTVVWLHSEESRSLIVPKLRAALADESRVMFLEVGRQMDDRVSETRLELPRDTDRLTDELALLGCKFVVFDALTSFKSGGKSANSVDDVREFLEPIQTMAGKLGAVVLGIAHLGKSGERDARDAVLGSSAWTDVPRSVLAFARDTETDTGVISAVKANLSPVKRSIGYEFETVRDPDVGEIGRVQFTGDTDVTVDALRARDAHDGDEAKSQADEIRDWLTDYLTEQGPTMKTDVVRDAVKALGASQRSIERHATGVVRSVNVGFPRRAQWSLMSEVGGTGATGADQHKYSDATVTPSSEVGGTVAEQSLPMLTSANTDEAHSHASHANCEVCGEPMSFPPDIDAGSHEACR